MLYRLEIENFYSIRDRQVIDLSVGKTAIDSFEKLVPIGPGEEDYCPRVISFFGANASGKSTVLKAISFVMWFVGYSFQNTPDRIMPYNCFAGQSAQNKPTRLAIWFTAPTVPSKIGEPDECCSRYCYEIILKRDRLKPQTVYSESLKYWSYDTKRQVVLFSRSDDGKIKAHKSFGLSGFDSALEKILRTNVSVLSTLAQLKHHISTKLWEWSTQVYSNILLYIADFDENALFQLYKSDPELLKALNSEMQKFDIGIKEMELHNGNGNIFPAFHHTGLDNPIMLTFESHGTKQFIKVFPLIFAALNSGGIAIIDELDMSIHPLVLPEILSWFSDSVRNPHGAQLWLTGQNPSLLEHLSKEEIFFCEKDTLGRTSVYGLTEIKDVRRNDNFYRKYLGGVYGAVPTLG